MRKRLAYAVAVSALTTNLCAQQLAETIEVRVANIDVVVTDRDGRPVRGLTKDDFELDENRKPQTITNFYEIRGDAPAVATAENEAVAPAEMRARSIVVFIDNSSIDPLRRNQMLDATWAAVDRLMRRGDDAMLVTWDHRTQVLQPFTADTAALKRALDGAHGATAAASTISFQRNDVISYATSVMSDARTGRVRPGEAYSQAVGKARAYAEWLRATEREMLSALTAAIATLSGIEGKKVLIFVGGELQQQPGLDVFQQVDSMFMSLVRTMMPAVIRENDLQISDDLQKVARSANANGVTMYMINVADRSRSALDTRLPDSEVAFTQDANTYLSMAGLAADTGGAVLSGTSNYSSFLDTISRDLGSYYSLGYRPAGNAVDRTISVKVKRPGAIVRTRRAYAIKSADDEMHDRVIANAYHEMMRSDFPVAIATAPAEPFQNGLLRVKVTLSFPSDLTYLPEGQDLAGEYAVYFVTVSDDGGLSPLGKQVQTVRFAANALATMKQRPLTHGAALIVKPGSMIVSAAVVDKVGGRVGFARTKVVAR